MFFILIILTQLELFVAFSKVSNQLVKFWTWRHFDRKKGRKLPLRIKSKIDKYKIKNKKSSTKHDLKLNMKNINKIFNSKGRLQMHFFLNDVKKQHIFAETCLYETVGTLPVMSSLLPHVLWGRSQVSLFCVV